MGSSVERPLQEAASSTAAKTASSDDKRPVTPKLDLASPKNEMANDMFSNDSRSVPPNASVLRQHCDTKRSMAVQTADSVEHEDFIVGLAHDVHDDDGGHPDVSQRSVAAVVQRFFVNKGWNSVAFTGLWTRFATQAGSYQSAPQQLSLSNYGTGSRLPLLT